MASAGGAGAGAGAGAGGIVPVEQAKQLPGMELLQEAAHKARVAFVSEQMRRKPADKFVTVAKKTPSHQPHSLSYKNDCHPVDVSALGNILGIDSKTLTATVEAQVDLGQLCKATMAQGNLMPQVVPEYPSFTIAGLISGGGIQSSCHRYGLFNQTVEWMEVVLGDGQVVIASPHTNADLFRRIHGSFCTLGFVTAAGVALVQAAPYVRSQYLWFDTIEPYVACLKEHRGQEMYMDGVVFSKKDYLVVLSEFVDEPEGLTVYHPGPDPSNDGNEWYYQYCENTRKRGVTEDVIPSIEFVFRSVRGAWWVIEDMVNNKTLTNARWMRKIIDKKAREVEHRSGFSDHLFTVDERERNTCLQDLGVNFSRLGEAIRLVQERIGVYPMWNCVVDWNRGNIWDHARPDGHPIEDYIVDVGLYGEPKVKPYYNIRRMRELQLWMDSPSYWGVCYMTKKEIEARVVSDEARLCRTKYKAAGAFKPIEDKVHWIKPDGPDPGQMSHWRLRRSWRESKPGFFLTIFLMFVFNVLIPLFFLWVAYKILMMFL